MLNKGESLLLCSIPSSQVWIRPSAGVSKPTAFFQTSGLQQPHIQSKNQIQGTTIFEVKQIENLHQIKKKNCVRKQSGFSAFSN